MSKIATLPVAQNVLSRTSAPSAHRAEAEEAPVAATGAEPYRLQILGAGQNWVHITSQLAHQLSGHLGKARPGSTVAMVSGDPMAMCMDGPRWIADGRYDMGITTPLWYARMAIEGRGRFKEPLPLKLIAVLPHDDQLALAVRRDLGIRSLHDVRERRYPLRVSMHTAQSNTPAGWVIEEIFRQYGFSIDDIRQWGGVILNDQPADLSSATAVPVDPSFHAVMDEAVMTRRWHRIADQYDLHYLSLDESVLARCEDFGMERGVLKQGRMRGVRADVPAIDFGGWALYCRSDCPDEVAYFAAKSLHEQQAHINKRFDVPYPGMTAPIDIRHVDETDLPIHPGAARYYAELRQNGQARTITPVEKEQSRMAEAKYDPLSILPQVPSFALTSPTIRDGGQLPKQQVFNGLGLDGGNISPALQWSGFPEGTKSFMVACYDPDAPTMSGFWHWVAVDIPADITSLPEGAGRDGGLPAGFHIRNDYGTRDFGGAAPPPGDAPHRYIFVVHALGGPSLGVPAEATPAYATFAAGFQVLGRATLTAYFGRDAQ